VQTAQLLRLARQRVAGRVGAAFGYGSRWRTVLLLAATLGLNSADLGMIGAVAPDLERAFGLSATQLGLLATASSGVGAVVCLPMGALADRVSRVRLLTVAIAIWAVALILGGAAPSYPWLLVSRVLLGAASAASGPVLASLIGDAFPAAARTRVYGQILAGEMVGAGIGLIAGGNIAAALSWRWSMWLLAAIAAVLAVVIARVLPEPARQDSGGWAGAKDLWAGFRYVLATPTLRLLVVASSVGYFFFSGLRTFAVTFAQRQYGLPVPLTTLVLLFVGLAALVGVLSAGTVTEWAGRRVAAPRIVVPAVTYGITAVALIPGFLLESVWAALPFLVLGAAMLGASNPPLDAARLDLVPAGLWGRAETARTVLRLAAEATAPLIFGVLTDAMAGTGAGARSGGVAGSGGGAGGLRASFLLMLIPLLVNGLIVLRARHSYDTDVRRAATRPSARPQPSGLGDPA
jgi:predicted MFS family arabinose efflux permease